MSMWSTPRLNDMDKGPGSASALPGSAAALGGIPEPEIPAGGADLRMRGLGREAGHGRLLRAGAFGLDHDGRATSEACFRRVIERGLKPVRAGRSRC